MVDEMFGAGFLMGFVFSCVLTIWVTNNIHERACIEKGVGHYNSQTGEFEYVAIPPQAKE